MTFLRQLFERLSFREKLLLSLFVWVLLLLGLNSVTTNLRLAWLERKAHEATYQDYETRLQQEPLIAQLLTEAQARFDPEKTRDSAELTGHIDYLVNTSGLSPRNFNTRTQPGDMFDWHEMSLSLGEAPLESLMRFVASIRREAPYINLEQVRLSADQRNPELVDARFLINSFELRNGAGNPQPAANNP